MDALVESDWRDLGSEKEKKGDAGFSLFAMGLSFASTFGFVEKVSNTYRLGPNIAYELPTEVSTSSPDYPGTRTTSRGESFSGVSAVSFSPTSSTDLFLVKGPKLILLPNVAWRICNLNTSFDKIAGATNPTLLVYSDLVESTVIGEQSHPL